jgi:AcrR family transcriptional regulator
MPRRKVPQRESAYHAHRERQRRRILDAARVLFDTRGIDRVTMAEITLGSGVQPSTMYQYFSNKDEIVWALLSESMQEDVVQAGQQINSATTALEKLTALFDFMVDGLVNSPAKIRFMAQFDAMYARDWPAERLITLETQINPEGFQGFSELIREGIGDGSLRSDLDPNLTMHAVMNAIIGAQRRLASLGNKIEKEYGEPVDRLFRETIRVILLGLRAPENPRLRPARKTQTIAKARNRKRSS